MERGFEVVLEIIIICIFQGFTGQFNKHWELDFETSIKWTLLLGIYLWYFILERFKGCLNNEYF